MELTVGRVGRASGLRGEVLVQVRTDQPDVRFAPGQMLRTDPAETGPLTVTGARWQGNRLVVSFGGVGDRAAAERLRGVLLLADVAESERPEDPDEFYDHQLVGLVVDTLAGARLGTVTEVLHLPMQDVLAVRDDDGREVLLPFVRDLVPTVDLEHGRLVAEPPAGLVEEAER